MQDTVKPLVIGNLVAKIPIIQGGMGVGISLSSLAGTVAAEGGVGVISTAQIGFKEEGWLKNPIETNLLAIGKQICLAKEKAKGGIVGVNIMVATKYYEKYVKAAVKAGVDLIISGAGLPVSLPEYVKGTLTKIAPVISTEKAARVICKLWDRKSQRAPDLLIVEGPEAGGHLGFTYDEVIATDAATYDKEIQKIIEVAKEFGNKFKKKIPVVVAGGIDNKEKMKHYLELGADGVQVATSFVTTKECDAPDSYKQAYINAKKKDIVLVKSPVGMPGRAIRNKFIDAVNQGKKFPVQCKNCISMCNHKDIPYCITDALVNAARGNIDDALVFCGANAYKAAKITTVREVIKGFIG